MRIIILSAVFSALVATSFSACSGMPSAEVGERVDGHLMLNCSFDYLKTGESRRYYVKQSPAAANYRLYWESSDEGVATVDDNGNVTAVESGKATVTVCAEGLPYRASLELTVADEIVDGEDGKQGLQEAVDRVKNNGSVLVTGGYHGCVTVGKRLTLTGAGKAAVSGVELLDDAQLFMQSISVYAAADSGGEACVKVGKNASLTAVGCDFFYDDPTGETSAQHAVAAPSDAYSLYCRACSFDGYDVCLDIGATDGELYVVNSDFSNAETAVLVDLRGGTGEEDKAATGRIADNVYVGCKTCVKLLFNALSYTGGLEIPDADLSVPE